MKTEPIDLLEEPKAVDIEEKSAAIMSRNDLLDNACCILKESGIDTIQQLAKQLKSNQKIQCVEHREVFVELLKKELSILADQRPKTKSSEEVGKYLAERYADLDHEELHVISTNNNNRIIADDCVAIGQANVAAIDVSAIMRRLIVNKATGFFIMHNHPSGSLVPSRADDSTTERILKTAEAIGLNSNFLDHFIVSDGGYYSYRENEKVLIGGIS